MMGTEGLNVLAIATELQNSVVIAGSNREVRAKID